MTTPIESANRGSINSGTLTGAPANCDFVTAYAGPNQILCTGLPGPLLRENLSMITVFKANGARSITYPSDYPVITIVGGDTIQIDNIVYPLEATDTFVVHTNIPRDVISTISLVDAAADKTQTFTYDSAGTNYQRVATIVTSSALLGLSYTTTYTYADPDTNFQRVTSIVNS